MGYYDAIAPGYDELHKEEQLAKITLMLDWLRIRPEDRVLDVGCGTAFSFELLLPLTPKVQGVEPAKGLITQSRYAGKITNCAAEKLPFPDRLFTVVLSVTALQNFDDPRQGLMEMRRVCSDRLAISFLKRSGRAAELRDLIRELFTVEEEIEENKDLIFCCKVCLL